MQCCVKTKPTNLTSQRNPKYWSWCINKMNWIVFWVTAGRRHFYKTRALGCKPGPLPRSEMSTVSSFESLPPHHQCFGEFYSNVIAEIELLLDGETDYVANCANTASLVFHALKKVSDHVELFWSSLHRLCMLHESCVSGVILLTYSGMKRWEFLKPSE